MAIQVPRGTKHNKLSSKGRKTLIYPCREAYFGRQKSTQSDHSQDFCIQQQASFTDSRDTNSANFPDTASI